MAFAGVVPESASRSRKETTPPVIGRCYTSCHISFSTINTLEHTHSQPTCATELGIQVFHHSYNIALFKAQCP